MVSSSAINEESPLLEGLDREEDEQEQRKSCHQRIFSCAVEAYQDNKFVIHIAMGIGLAKLYPPLGAVYLKPEITATWIAVIFIFTMAGLSLRTHELTKALTNMKFNCLIQLYNFGFVSLLVFGVTRILLKFKFIADDIANGMVICACMPITVTMVIVLTKSANGDDAAAILNAALGSLLGVFVSPLLILSYIGVQADIDMVTVFIKLCLRVLVPLGVGQLLQNYSQLVVEFVKKYKSRFKTCQEWALVFIVYTAFCKTFSGSESVDATWTSLIVMAISQILCLVLCMYIAWVLLKVLYRNEPKLRAMGLYGCTHKSVAMGIPLLNAIYENDPHLGLYTLPLLIWHPAQLMIGSSLAPRLAKGVDQLHATYLNRPEHERRESRRVSFFSKRPQLLKKESFVAFEIE